jgi:hypothetical protein
MALSFMFQVGELLKFRLLGRVGLVNIAHFLGFGAAQETERGLRGKPEWASYDRAKRAPCIGSATASYLVGLYLWVSGSGCGRVTAGLTRNRPELQKLIIASGFGAQSIARQKLAVIVASSTELTRCEAA